MALRLIKKYLLKKQGGKCAYCGREGVAVAVDHVVPRNPKHGPRGSDSMKNLVVVCTACNSSKGNLQPEEWLERLKKARRRIDRVRAENLRKLLEEFRRPLRDALLINAARWELRRRRKVVARMRSLGRNGGGADYPSVD